ncbi:MAG: hypothetical protein ACTHJ4_08245 [Candidatus Nucleicultricaceae bacterium]
MSTLKHIIAASANTLAVAACACTSICRYSHNVWKRSFTLSRAAFRLVTD